ncbi:response regulator transcription factor [bacterium]|nr:response regulator transcription factor [bacterium]
MSVSILLADDHTLVRTGFKSLIEDRDLFDVVAEASNGRETVRLAQELKPDIILMDINMPDLNGIEATRKIVEFDPAIKVIGLSIYSDKVYISGMLRAGASGYLLKDCEPDELTEAIFAVRRNEIFIDRKIMGTVIGDYRKFLLQKEESPYSLLTEREREVLQLIAEGKNTKQIASDLSVSVKTIETHRQNLMHKLDIYSVQDLVKYAIKHGVITLE